MDMSNNSISNFVNYFNSCKKQKRAYQRSAKYQEHKLLNDDVYKNIANKNKEYRNKMKNDEDYKNKMKLYNKEYYKRKKENNILENDNKIISFLDRIQE